MATVLKTSGEQGASPWFSARPPRDGLWPLLSVLPSKSGCPSLEKGSRLSKEAGLWTLGSPRRVGGWVTG